MNTTRGRVWRAVGSAMVLLAASQAVGQFQPPTQDQPGLNSRAPSPSRADQPPAFWAFATMVLLGFLVIGPAFIPSKRGHQD